MIKRKKRGEETSVTSVQIEDRKTAKARKQLQQAQKRADRKKAKREAKLAKRRKRRENIYGLFRSLFDFVDRLGIKERIQSSLMAQILLNFAIAIICAFIVYSITGGMLTETKENVKITYKYGYESIVDRSNDLFLEADSLTETEGFEMDDFHNLIASDLREHWSYMSTPEIYVTDMDGNVLIKNAEATAQKLDMLQLIEMAARSGLYDDHEQAQIVRLHPMTLGDLDGTVMLVYMSTPKEQRRYETYELRSGGPLPYLNGIGAFLLVFMLLTRRKIRYITEISDGLLFIANGNLEYNIEEVGTDELRLLSENINFMRRSLNRKIIEQQEAENTKNELITNVSHDLRTPLTSIMGYLGLVRDGRYSNEEELKEYLDIAFNKSEQLRLLIDDLFEYTKYTHGDIQVNAQDISMNQLILQLLEEYVPVVEQAGLFLNSSLPDYDLMVHVDPAPTVRVLENLLMNAVKYAHKPSEVRISLRQVDAQIIVTVDNQGDTIPEDDLKNIFERFYKLDKSRQESGSGLGLAIAKNIVERQGGEIWAESQNNRIRFNVAFSAV